ncbi:MAG: pilus assembly protein [Celeribacter marinus]
MINRLKTAFRTYHPADDGAVTVDWVVLTSAVVGLGVVVLQIVWGGANIFPTNVNSDIENIDVVNYEEGS